MNSSLNFVLWPRVVPFYQACVKTICMDTTENKQSIEKNATAGMTPNEIIHYHLQHPDEPITDEVIRQAKISNEDTAAPPVVKEEVYGETAEKGDGNDKKEDRDFPVRSTYDVLGN
jgi:hypothetical protein